MALFNSDSERARKENLRLLEDKRVRFAQQMEARGFRPERMFFCSREDGSFAALARHEGKLALIVGPKFGTDEDFSLDLLDEVRFDREEVFEKGTGLNGAFGFGTKGARGFNLFVRNSDQLYVKFPVVFGRNSWLETPYRKNPLLKTKRRRGDANVVWDFVPIDSPALNKIEALLNDYYLAGVNAADAKGAKEDDSFRISFYEQLRAEIQAEGLERYTQLKLGDVSEEAHCLSVVRHDAGDCEVCYYAEPGRAMFHEEHLTEEQATDKCLAFLRDQKKSVEYFRNWQEKE